MELSKWEKVGMVPPLFWVFTMLWVLAYYYLVPTNYRLSQKFDVNGGTWKIPRPEDFVASPYLKHWYMDCSDDQLYLFRQHLLLFVPLLFMFVSISNIVRIYYSSESDLQYPAKNGEGSLPPKVNSIHPYRLIFYCVVGAGFTIVSYGGASILPFSIVFVSYFISSYFASSKWNPILTWVFNLTVLYSSDYYHGYSKYTAMIPVIGYITNINGFLRWQVFWRFSCLRLISFNMDRYWMLKCEDTSMAKGKPDYTQRSMVHHASGMYNFWTLFAYTFYPPLYLAGPICSFNAFISQVAYPQTQVKIKSIVNSFIQLMLWYSLLVAMTHFCYNTAINDFGFWKELDYFWDIVLINYTQLLYMFLKFFVIWRFFRLIALLDGIDTPENMGFCINTSMSFERFWRGWHASFNKWTVRYLYIPLGGKKNQFFSIWIIFFFIGLWHDLWLEWLAWAFFNCVCFSVEIAIRQAWMRSPKLHGHWWTFWVELMGNTISNLSISLTNLAIAHGFEGSFLLIENVFFKYGNWIQITQLLVHFGAMAGCGKTMAIYYERISKWEQLHKSN